MRRAKIEDVPTLLKLAKMVHFINLPADKDIIAEKVRWSQRCFEGVAGGEAAARGRGPRSEPEDKRGAGASDDGLTRLLGSSKLFMFVLEDTESGGVLGTSQIITNMGGPGHPNLSFELKRKEMFSTSLQMGTTHIVAKLKLDETGPTEIGGLILQPSYRGHKARLGRFLSWIRFHFIALHRDVFADRILAELMGPITPDGQSTLWEYLGRRFINLTYIEADRFCQHSKEFMLNLLPREEIYLTLLPPEARRLVAQVGPETEPAKKMLEKLGFEYKNCIDPFDGGPNLEAATDDVSIVRETHPVVLGEPVGADGGGTPSRAATALVSAMGDDGELRALQVSCMPEGRRGETVRLTREEMEALRVEPGARLGFTPLDRARTARKETAARTGGVNGAARDGTPAPRKRLQGRA